MNTNHARRRNAAPAAGSESVRARRRHSEPVASDPEPVRAFIAIPLPAEWTAALSTTVAQLRAIAPSGVRWTNPEGIHLTLQFLGDTDARLIPDIIAALTRHLTGTTAGCRRF